MEFNQENRSFCTTAKVLDTVAEQLADVDFTLPDYCPDIEKILKCTLTPKIQSRSLSGGQLQIDGYCIVNVMYVESIKKTIRCCEQSVSFSQSFTIKETPDAPVILTKTKPEYINCRALSPRRLVMHGAFSLYVKVLGTENKEIYTSSSPDLETLRHNVRCADLKSLCQECFTVSEGLSVADKPAIESIIHSDVGAGITDYKAVTGKLMLNGEINLRMLYLTDVESGETAKLDYLLPFNQIIDCEGIDENTINCVSCDVLSYDIRLKNDMMSEKPSVVIDVKLCITEEGYLVSDTQVITDAYSVLYASKPEFSRLEMTEDVVPLGELHMEKGSIKIDDGKISKVIDIYTDSISAEAQYGEGGLKAVGKISVCMLALNEDNMPVFIERSFDYEHIMTAAADCNNTENMCARLASISFRLAEDNTVEIRCELRITAFVYKKESLKAVCNTEIFEDNPIKDDGCALTLYYADKGERLWDIAKSHNTRLDMLISENNADSQTTDGPQMLLIPRV